jgi:hypothetical protein
VEDVEQNLLRALLMFMFFLLVVYFAHNGLVVGFYLLDALFQLGHLKLELPLALGALLNGRG